jgi:hypothetical protein
MHPERFARLSLLVLLVCAVSTAGAVDITACGQNVPNGEIGDLVGSLDCTGTVGHCADTPELECTTDDTCFDAGDNAGCITYAVRMGTKSTLRMHGFSIVGGPFGGNNLQRIDYGVLCRGRNCVVEGGGGTLETFGHAGIWHWGGGSITVSAITFQDLGRAVTASFLGRKMIISDLTAHGGGIMSSGNVVATNVNLIHVPLPSPCESAPAIYGRKVTGSNVTATYVQAARGIDVVGLTVDASPSCSDGVYVQKGRVRLTDSSITGAPRFDIVSRTRPQLVNTVCGTSGRIRGDLPTDETWGVCAND